MIIGFNGGPNTNAGRTFLVDNRAKNIGMTITFTGITVAAAETNAVSYATITVNGKTWYQDATKVAVDAAYTGIPVFAIYHYGYTGTLISNKYGAAFIIDEATGKVVKVYDGANAKYYDAANPNGVIDKELCTAEGYITQAFAALEEGQYLLIAPNGGTTGNVARAFFLNNRKIDIAVSYTVPTTQKDENN
jgi:hypothetical protein